MFNTPSKRSTLRAYSTPTKIQLKGLFQDGVWHCNCTPRLPASHFQVRKESSNKGRWFYTCQESKGSGCGFFLWDEDAAPRMMRAVVSNSRSEPEAESRTPTSLKKNRLTVEGYAEASNKWMNDRQQRDEDEFGDWPMSDKEESEVAAILSEAEKKLSSTCPQTPRKAIKLEEGATPSSKRRWADIMPTPNTGASASDVFSTPKSRSNGGMFDRNESRRHLLSPSATPTPSRFRDASEPGESSNTGEVLKNANYDITDEVLGLLKGQSVDDETIHSLQQLLNRHALRTQGIVKGRDITRIALKARDAKISELEQKITALETEREMDKVVIQHFKSDMAESIKRRGRGRGG